MKNLAMYMLLKLAGKEPTAEMVEESLKACEIEANNEICEEKNSHHRAAGEACQAGIQK